MVTSRKSHLINMFPCLVVGVAALAASVAGGQKCEGGGQRLTYLWGDALTDPVDCIGPGGIPYPAAAIARSFRSNSIWTGSTRSGRNFNGQTMDPHLTSKTLLHNYKLANDASDLAPSKRSGRANTEAYRSHESCARTPARLCKTRYNTTAPMYGVSLTSGQPVTIVQKFPDLLQQVVFETCESSECDVVRGECTQTYVPYLFLVIPLGPVTLTGQDYVLVESGCVCKPKYASSTSSNEPSSKSVLPHL